MAAEKDPPSALPQPPLERVYRPCRRRRRFIIIFIIPADTHRRRRITTTIISGRYPAVPAEDRRPSDSTRDPLPPVVAVGAAGLAVAADPGICTFAKRNTLALIVGVVS